MENTYTTEEISKILKISEHIVMEHLRKESLRGQKIGTVWKVSESDLEEFLETWENSLEHLIHSQKYQREEDAVGPSKQQGTAKDSPA